MSSEEKGKAGTLRQVMPQCAEIVDWLRQQFGTEAADRILLGGKTGKGTCRLVEVGPDGQRREFGSMKPTKWPGDQPKEGAPHAAH